jgi:hypothetical protein
VAASVVDVGSGERSLVTGSSVREKRDERRWCGLHPLLGAGIWLVDCIGAALSLIRDGRGTLYLPPNVILLRTEVAELSGNKGEEGLVCPAETGLLPIAGRAWGSSCTYSSTSPGDIGTGSCLSMEMGNCSDTGDGSLSIGGSCI